MSKAQVPAESYFEFLAEGESFQLGFIRALQVSGRAVRAQYMPPENEQRLRHGKGWRHPGNDDAEPGEFETHGAELTLDFDDIVNNDLSLVERSVGHVADQMKRQFTAMLFGTVDRAVAKTGNSVDAKGKSMGEAYLEALSVVELRADRNGIVELPTMFTGDPAAYEKMRMALENTSSDFRERFEAVRARKTEEALARESLRKARFANYGDRT